MILKRIGKCAACGQPTSEKKDFPATIDMFDANAKEELKGSILEEVAAWRARDLYCENHRRAQYIHG